VGLSLGIAATVTPPRAHADESVTLPADLPPLPVLDPSLDPDRDTGRIARLVRARVVGMIKMLGSLTEGDIIATDGPISATELPEGGARVQFSDLTVLAGSSTGDPITIAFGDILVDAANGAAGRVTFQSKVAGPIFIFHQGTRVAEVTVEALNLEGEINPEFPTMGQDEITVRGMSMEIEDDMRDPLRITLAEGTASTRSGMADDGTLEATVTLDGNALGFARGQHDPTVSIGTLRSENTYNGVPGAWTDVLTLMTSPDRLVPIQETTAVVGRVMAQNELGNNLSKNAAQDIEIFLSPNESITIAGITYDIEMDEPINETAHGSSTFALDSLRTRGPDLPMAVDLGALRMTFEGEGLDVPRLRGFMAETMEWASEIPMDPEKVTPQMAQDMETRVLDDMIELIRDLGIGKAETDVRLSSLAVREGRTPLFSLDEGAISGGWEEKADGLLDGPSSIMVRGLTVADPSLGMPWSVGSATLDSQTRDLDLRALRELVVLFIQSADSPTGAPDPQAVAALADSMTVAGGQLTINLEGIALGTEMRPMGGLGSADLFFELEGAEPGDPVADARLTFEMGDLDLGPMAARAMPQDLIPQTASLALRGASLPVPGLVRQGMMTPADPLAADQAMEQALMAMLSVHQPSLTLESLAVDAPSLGIQGEGDVTLREPTPEGVDGGMSLVVRDLDRAMALLQEQVRDNPALQEPLIVLLGLRGMGRAGGPNTHVYDIELSPTEGALVNGTPIGALLMQAPPGPGRGPGNAPMGPQTPDDDKAERKQQRQ
jgi:hypothetical protein